MDSQRSRIQPKTNAGKTIPDKNSTQTRRWPSKPSYEGLSPSIMSCASLSDLLLTPQNILYLQRTIGNRAVRRIIQAKLKVGQPEDKYEQEADRMAEAVMRVQESPLQPDCAYSGRCQKWQTEQPDQEYEQLQTKRVTSNAPGQIAAPPIVHEVLRSHGQPLDPASRAFFEPRFGHDFSQVRVHTDSKAAESARAVNALAYTVGRDVVFGAEQYAPDIAKNKWLIAHELTHVVQAVSDPVSQGPIEIARPEDTCETLAAAAARGTCLPRHVYGPTRLYRAIQMPAARDDDTARRAAQAIEVARRRLREGELSPEQRTELERRIIDAEAALAAYRRDLGRSSGVGHMVGMTTTGNPAGALLALGVALLGWLIVSAPARDPALARELERALDLLVEPIMAARPQPIPLPEAPPQEIPEEIPVPHPPGEVIPIETHPRFQPRQQPSPPPEQRLGPDIFPVPRSEPRPRQRDRREECLETHPYALTCEDEVSMEEVVQDFIMSQGYSYESLGVCGIYDRHEEWVIDQCNGAPGETWHCPVSPYYDEIAGRSLPGGVVSIFSCLCCRTDGTTGFEWRGPHWSPGG